MKTVLHKASSRGHMNHGWLNTHHTFSFGSYYDPARVHFGMLRVLNDDTIAPGRGFGTHPHDNMEIITIPLSGELEHKDSMGNSSVIHKGEIQVMSAGSGIQHSEFNPDSEHEVSLLQIWVFPHTKNVEPRYDQIDTRTLRKNNELYQILSPNQDDQGVWIHQDAWFHLGELQGGSKHDYRLRKQGNGLYAFLISGELSIGETALSARDGLAITETDQVSIHVMQDSQLLLMEVPMMP